MLLGVLTAQGLQTWSREGELAEYSDKAMTRYEGELAEGLETTTFWQDALPRVRARVDRIMRLAGDDSLPPEVLEPPGLWSNQVTPLGEEVEIRFRDRADVQHVAVSKNAPTQQA